MSHHNRKQHGRGGMTNLGAPKAALSGSNFDDRLASLSDQARDDLMHHFFTFMTRLTLPPTGNCPTCGTTVTVAPTATAEE